METQIVIDVYWKKRDMELNLFKSIPCHNNLFSKNWGKRLKIFLDKPLSDLLNIKKTSRIVCSEFNL